MLVNGNIAGYYRTGLSFFIPATIRCRGHKNHSQPSLVLRD
jgi:hypothetical protein